MKMATSPVAKMSLGSSQKGSSNMKTDLVLEETENQDPQAPQNPIQVQPCNVVFSSTVNAKAGPLNYSLKRRI